MNRLTLEPNCWYAAELIGEEFGSEIRSYSPIRVDGIEPHGGRKMLLSFYHANYPEGVRNKVYKLQTLERNQHFIVARSSEHDPVRLLLIYRITAAWLREHFGGEVSDSEDVETWLARNA